MEISVAILEKLSDIELLDAYHKARRLYAEKKFARDTERGRLTWQSARLFVTTKGGITEREKTAEAAEDLAKKGQHIREMTLELDLLKADVALIYAFLHLRGVGSRADQSLTDEPAHQGRDSETI
jgi:hypothetical protein